MSKKIKHQDLATEVSHQRPDAIDPMVAVYDHDLEELRTLREMGEKLYAIAEIMGADNAEFERLRRINTHLFEMEWATNTMRKVRIAQITTDGKSRRK